MARAPRTPRREPVIARTRPDPAALIPSAEAAAIVAGTHRAPFALLGLHAVDDSFVLRAYLPGAETVEAITPDGTPIATLAPGPSAGVFAAHLAAPPADWRLRARRGPDTWIEDPPHRFPPTLGEQDLHFIGEGTHLRLWTSLGARTISHLGVQGTAFAVWAPNAGRVSVVGDFNGWDGRRHVMRHLGASGVWEIFLPGVEAGMRYMFEILDTDGRLLPLKSDPVGFGAELRPATASVVRDLRGYDWRDGEWMAARAARADVAAPVSIYEVHAASWRRAPGTGFADWESLATELVPYAIGMGFSHLELMPISEHPFDGSWGYQPVGLYAPTARHGDVAGFRRFVEACHDAGLGLILDWVPGHFPADPHGLARFDGTHLYEHADPREGFHPDWNTLIYNYGRREVANFLIANALYWLEAHHVDGLRVDAVASMLYRDYSRAAGQWVPNIHGGRENLEAIDFLRCVNATVAARVPGALTIAEESTAWPGVTAPEAEGGLGFGYKWNMGWMNDTLAYMAEDPVHRRWHHDRMTFGLHYAFSERFILPLSHDEVVHGKGSILGRMPGDRWQKFANLRAYYGFMWGHPGKKLLFMGSEFGQAAEWDHDAGLDWGALSDPLHAGARRLVADLNRLYRAAPALHQRDARADGFQWIDGAASEQSVLAWLRYGEPGTPPVAVVANLTPVPRENWRIGLPRPGHWAERLNTDARDYGGAGLGNMGAVEALAEPSHGLPCSASLTLPPLATLILEHVPG
ncbi:1,4-alpha-glucan branching protein GlgB [Limibaculum sp. FT325]|uniref:1,4-alpha-glucan branching protein GlgB n=1 Tax=Thermohalobaculum sediminis TaxID=2939436 RepID=UPI0020BF681C|nr:1,4-alpha-glucan branching protein GlgB [Limibaculum sediminis]MCL5777828.1 1,4-alpha-glucan branching protein GlgB [Limibaculum sediminis]